MKPSKLTKDQTVKVVKTIGYVGVSAAIAQAIAFVTDDPQMFGVLTPIVNVSLVTLKQFFSKV